MQPIEEQLKREILGQYRSVRAFTQALGLPYSTVDNIFKRGIGGTAVSTVARVFRSLGLDMDSIADGALRPRAGSEPRDRLLQSLMDNYDGMNDEGRRTLVRLSEDMAAGGRYRTRTSSDLVRFYAVARGKTSNTSSSVEGRRFDPKEVDGLEGEDF